MHATIDITSELTSASPCVSGGKVFIWELNCTYTNQMSGDDYYLVKDYLTIVTVNDEEGGFGLSAEGDWTRSDLEDLCNPALSADFAELVQQTYYPTDTLVTNHSYVIPT